MKRTALTFCFSLILAAGFGCNEDPRYGPFQRDVGGADVETPDSGLDASDGGRDTERDVREDVQEDSGRDIDEDTGPPDDPNEAWFQTACETTSPKPLNLETNDDGNWAFAPPTGISNYTNLSIDGYEAPHAAATYDSESLHVAGGVVSTPDSLARVGKETFRTTLDRTLPVDFTQDPLGSTVIERESPDGRPVKIYRTWGTTSEPATVQDIRSDVLVGLGAFDESDIPGIKRSGSKTSSHFRIEVAAHGIPRAGDSPHRIYGLSVEHFRGQHRAFSTDARSLESLAPLGTATESHCVKERMEMPRPLYLYFVVDVDGPDGWEAKVAQLVEWVAEDSIYRRWPTRVKFGITNTLPANGGRLHGDDGWLGNLEKVKSHLKDAALDCQSSADWACSGTRDGLKSARQGLTYMDRTTDPAPLDERLRPEGKRKLAVVFISDETPASVQDGSKSLEFYPNFLRSKSPSLIGLVSTTMECRSSAASSPYLALGADIQTDLCSISERYGDLHRALVDESFTASPVSQPTLHDYITFDKAPIPPSLRVYQNEAELPRGSGFEYHPAQGIRLMGEYSPDNRSLWGGPYYNVLRFYSWDYGLEE